MREVSVYVVEINFTCVFLSPWIISVPGSRRGKFPFSSGSSGVHLLPRFRIRLKVIYVCRKRKMWVEVRFCGSELAVLRFIRLLGGCGRMEKYSIRGVIIWCTRFGFTCVLLRVWKLSMEPVFQS